MTTIAHLIFPFFQRARSRALATGVLMAGLIGPSAHATFDPGSGYVRPQRWKAEWITDAASDPRAYGVYHFRRQVNLPGKPARFVVQVSADNRYRLFVNGASVAVGPALGDLMHWRYETVDLAPYLKSGDNVVAAVVWNFGPERAVAQASLRTAFLVQGTEAASEVLNTGPEWKVTSNPAYAPITGFMQKLETYIVVGPGEDVNGSAYPWGWEQPDFDDSQWRPAGAFGRGEPHGVGTGVDWWLVPRPIPQPEETPQRLSRVRRADGAKVSDGFLQGQGAFTVPARSRAVVLLDQGFETTAYPRLRVSGGKGAVVTAVYAEALVDAAGAKGHRDEIEGRRIKGFMDRFRPDGGADRIFSPLWYRTFRYVELAIETQDEPLIVSDYDGIFTAYPFKEAGRFASDDPELARIWQVGWRTARLCAFETYMDCPYYEQLQYAGDTRIQALISLYVSGDDRLMRQAIEFYDQSRIPEGLTQSRYPSHHPQIISTFSLFWADMVHDYWMHRDDTPFVERRLAGIRGVLDWFDARVNPKTGMLGGLPYWSFVDWPDAWNWDQDVGAGGEPPGSGSGGSAVLTLQLAGTLKRAAELFEANGEPTRAQEYRRRADALNAATMKLCWNDERQLVADTPAQTSYSQHANVMAVLAGTVSGDRAKELIARVARDRSLTPCTQYFRFYLSRALKVAGLGDSYVEMLQPWRDMLAKGLTTFAEREDPTRSDCHAWSASPNYELLATVCGIEPDSPGFKTVRIEPHFGALTHIEGRVPHPAGNIEVKLTRENGRVRGTISSPVDGRFLWQEKSHPLKAGEQTIDL